MSTRMTYILMPVKSTLFHGFTYW